MIPARPVVLGGDDVTIIVRADLAFAFTRTFLEAFENGSRAFLEGQSEIAAKAFTACAGLAFVKATFPFDRAYERAEELCGEAKSAAKRSRAGGEPVASALRFERITTSLTSDAAPRLTMQPYACCCRDSAGKLPLLSDIARLAAALPTNQRTAWRELVFILESEPDRAQFALDRMLEMARRDPSEARRIEAFGQSLAVLTGKRDQILDATGRTPLLDAWVVSTFSSPEEGAAR